MCQMGVKRILGSLAILSTAKVTRQETRLLRMARSTGGVHTIMTMECGVGTNQLPVLKLQTVSMRKIHQRHLLPMVSTTILHMLPLKMRTLKRQRKSKDFSATSGSTAMMIANDSCSMTWFISLLLA